MINCSLSDFLQKIDIHEQIIARVAGNCNNGYGPGSWISIIIQNEYKTELSGASSSTTLSRMDLFAATETLSSLPEESSVTINSSSLYLIKGMNKWIKNWKNNDWKKSDGALKNVDLWQKLDELSSKRTVKWVYAKNDDDDEIMKKLKKTPERATSNEIGERPEFTLVSNSEFKQRLKPEDTITIFTDGACKNNPGPGGWGAVLQSNEIETEISGGEFYTTNNRMELTAVIKALQMIPKGSTISLSTDSSYVKDGLKKWIKKWKSNDWKTNNGKPVKNQELWEILDGLISNCKADIQWVKGHVGNTLNERADRLAVGATPLRP